MTIATRPRPTESVSVEPDLPRPSAGSTATTAGRALQATWLGYLLYALWASSAGPDHPEPPTWAEVPLSILSTAMVAAAVGLFSRRRWALWLSTGLALPMVGLAVMCQLADAGSHWIAEAGFAIGVVALSLHPQSWRMHTR